MVRNSTSFPHIYIFVMYRVYVVEQWIHETVMRTANCCSEASVCLLASRHGLRPLFRSTPMEDFAPAGADASLRAWRSPERGLGSESDSDFDGVRSEYVSPS
jgi:hypothetical protein